MPLTALAGSLLAAGCLAVAAQTPATPPKPHTRAETLALVRQDVAAREKVAAASVTVVRQEDRVWDDDDLGCAARKGLKEPSPVPGYLFVVQAGGLTVEYHSDRMGRIKRCPPSKPRASGGR